MESRRKRGGVSYVGWITFVDDFGFNSKTTDTNDLFEGGRSWSLVTVRYTSGNCPRPLFNGTTFCLVWNRYLMRLLSFTSFGPSVFLDKRGTISQGRRTPIWGPHSVGENGARLKDEKLTEK